jgi:CheY-like chemotaxis protein
MPDITAPSPFLLVDDNEDDVLIAKAAYKRAQVPHPLQSVTGGREAIDYLEGNGGYSDRSRYPLPSLVLLDLKMPLVNGFDVIRRIRSHADLKRSIIVVMTSSSRESDINQAYELGANSYLVKPSDVESLISVFKSLHNYWMTTNISSPFPS